MAKEITHLDHYCQAFLDMCSFAVLSTATADGDPDISPRGGDPGFLRVLDPKTLLLPDRLGNNRLDSLRKLTVNPRVALLCFVPGIDETLRIYGGAQMRSTADAPVDVTEHGRPPRSLLVITVQRAFLHCAKALMRGRLWDPTAHVPRDSFPSAGEVLRAHTGDSDPVEDQAAMLCRYRSQL